MISVEVVPLFHNTCASVPELGGLRQGNCNIVRSLGASSHRLRMQTYAHSMVITVNVDDA